MAEFKDNGDNGDDSSEGEEHDLVLQDAGDEEAGSNHHTLKLTTSIAVKSEVLCLAFSHDGRYLLACCGDGMVRVFNPSTGVIISVLFSEREKKARNGEAQGGDGGDSTSRQGNRKSWSILDNVELPCTCAAFRPPVKLREKTSGVVLLGYARGEIQLWHVPSAKLLHRQDVPEGDAEPELQELQAGRRGSLSSQVDEYYAPPIEVEVLCCAYSGDANSYAVGSSDGIIRIYSDSTKELQVELRPGTARGSGHSSRVFSVKFHPDDPNIIVSGGWDKCVHVWDVEKELAVRTVFGPNICGDSVDVAGNTIVTGSWRDDSQLEMWDLESGKASGPSFWSGHGKVALSQQGWGRRCRLYAVAFGGAGPSRGRFLAAGGGEGANEVKVFDFFNDQRLIGSLLGLSAGAICLAFGPEGDMLAVGLANGQVHLVDIEVVTEVTPPNTGGKTIMVF